MVVGTERFALFGGVYFYINVIYLAFSALLFIHLKRFFWIFFIFFLFLAIYAPVGILYGEINEAFVLAIWGTWGSEVSEFAKTMPIRHIIFSFLSVFLFVYFYLITKKVNFKSKKIILLYALFILMTAFGKPLHIGTTSTFTHAIKHFKKSIDYVKLCTQTTIEPKWQIKSVNPKYKNFVVVIGESARRDYFEIYGYGVKNTPFLHEINGTFIDGYTATGLNTIPALKYVLSENADMNLNIVDLANLAGFETLWLSNQYYSGFHDTANTLIAKRANFIYFIRKDDKIKEKSDENLIKKFSEFLNKKSEKNRVIFLHTIGSHPLPCERLTSNEYQKYMHNDTFEINCYVESIAQTDKNLKLLYEILNQNYQKTGESFSMIYFSDHGVTHKYEKNSKFPKNFLVQTNASKEHFAIPLIKISSDDSKQKFIKNESYANYFPQNFARWLGVQTENLSEFSNIFSEVSQKDTIGAKNLVKNPNPDPAIDISKFK